MSKNLPLISCICVTRNKPAMLQRVISCFQAQSYPSKELVILYEDDDILTKHFMHTWEFDLSIMIVEIKKDPKKSLGELRNIAIDKANGDFICQWDDDDWYHIKRLECQYRTLSDLGQEANVMTRWILFDNVTGNAYLSNKRLWEGSILCRKDVLQKKKYEDVARGEDTAVITYLHESNYLCELSGMEHIYVYIYHGYNTWHSAHWDYLFSVGEKLQEDQIAGIRAVLEGKYNNVDGSLLMDGLFKKHYQVGIF